MVNIYTAMTTGFNLVDISQGYDAFNDIFRISTGKKLSYN